MNTQEAEQRRQRLTEYLQDHYKDLYGFSFCVDSHTREEGENFADVAFSALENFLDDGAPETADTDMLNDIACSFLYDVEEWAQVLAARDNNSNTATHQPKETE